MLSTARMGSLECLNCCVGDVERSVIGKLVLALVIISLSLVGHLRVVLSCKQIVGISINMSVNCITVYNCTMPL